MAFHLTMLEEEEGPRRSSLQKFIKCMQPCLCMASLLGKARTHSISFPTEANCGIWTP
jgi:hypothetical protein